MAQVLSDPEGISSRIRFRGPWKETWLSRLALGVLVLVFGHFALLCWHPTWGGDFQMYVAGVSRLYVSVSDPGHEAMVAPTEQSIAYTPYLVWVALLGKALGLSPYGALQWAGACNVAVWLASAAFLFYRISVHRNWLVPTACYVLATLTLHWRFVGWSSVLSLTGLQYLQAYPSTLGWACAHFALGLGWGLRSRWRWKEGVLLAAIVGLVLASHALTASWLVGILGLLGLWESARTRRVFFLVRLLCVLGAGLVLAAAWPYGHFLRQSTMAQVEEGAPFGGWPWVDYPNLHIIGVCCFAYLLWKSRAHAFWVLGLVVTWLTLGVWNWMGFSFGDRYAVFATFFSNLAVAEVVASGLLRLGAKQSEAQPSRARLERFAPLLVGAAAVASVVASPFLRSAIARKDYGAFWLPWEVVERSSPEEAYYGHFASLKSALHRSDVVLMVPSRAAFDLAATTGVSVTCSPYALMVPDAPARCRAARRYFQRDATQAERRTILKSSGATAVLVPRRYFGLLGALSAQLGKPAVHNRQWALFRTAGVGEGEPARGQRDG